MSQGLTRPKFDVLGNFSCQPDTPGEREPQSWNFLHWTGFWLCLWGIFLVVDREDKTIHLFPREPRITVRVGAQQTGSLLTLTWYLAVSCHMGKTELMFNPSLKGMHAIMTVSLSPP